MCKGEGLVIYSVGHSNRTAEDFISLLRENGVNFIIDIRQFPVSKWEWFRKESLRSLLSKNGIGYIHLGKWLGGFRYGGYEEHMKSEEFKRGIKKILKYAKKYRVAIMCAEKLVFRCHRRFVSRYLQCLGARVIQIFDHGKNFELKLLSEFKP